MGEDLSDDFGIGTTLDLFHSVGTCPCLIDKLKSFVTDGAMLVAVCFSIVADTPSGPVALDISRFPSRCSTSSMVQRSPAEHSDEANMLWSSSDKGEWRVLKQVEKNEFSMLAFSVSSVVLAPLWDRVGIEWEDFFRLLTQSYCTEHEPIIT